MASPIPTAFVVSNCKKDRLKLHVGLIFAQVCFAGFEILTRTALFDGANQLAFTFYRNILACLVLGPVAYFVERKQRPALNFWTVFMLFLSGLVGVTVNQLSYLLGLKYTSTVFASAMRNLTPIFTFLLAIISRVEAVNVKRRDGLAKVFGCFTGLGGACLLSVFHASVATSSVVILQNNHTSSSEIINIQYPLHITQWNLGSIFLILSFLTFAVSLILQSSILEYYPAPLSIGAFSCLFSSLQLGVISCFLERDMASWKLSTSEVFSILYAGAIGSGLVSGIQSWGVQKGGPVIVAAYQPLETVAVAIFYVFSGDKLLMSSLFGIVMVISGLFLLIWGQEEEQRWIEFHDSMKRPLLLDDITVN